MANRILVHFKGIGDLPINPTDYWVLCGEANRVGDEVIIQPMDITKDERQVMRLCSDGMCEDTDYLVDIKGREAWELK